MSGTVYLELHDILPHVEIDFERYAKFELAVINPALIAAGYVLLGPWTTGDGDGFGPLTRCVRTDRGVVVYG